MRVLQYTLAHRLDDASARFISQRLLRIKGVEEVSVSPSRREVVVRVRDLEPKRVREALEEAGFPPELQRITLFSEAVGSWRWSRVQKSLTKKNVLLRANPLTGLISVKYDENELRPEEVLGELAPLSPEPTGSETLLSERLKGKARRAAFHFLTGLALGGGAWAAVELGRLNLSATLGLLGAAVLGRELWRKRAWRELFLGLGALALSLWDRLQGGAGFFHLVPAAWCFSFGLEALITGRRLGFLKEVWSLQSSLPTKARVLKGKEAEECAAQELEPGEVVQVKPGEPVPADGIDEEGRWRRQGERGEGFRLTVVYPYRLGYAVRLLANFEEALSSGSPSFSARLFGDLVGLGAGFAAAFFALPGVALALLPWGRALQWLVNLPKARLAAKALKLGLVVKPLKLRRWAWLRSLVLPLGSALGPYRGEMPPEAARLVSGLMGKIRSAWPERAKARVLHPEEGVEAEGWRFGHIRFVGLGSYRERGLLFPVFLRSPEGEIGVVKFRREMREGARELVAAFRRRYLLTSAPKGVAEAWARELGGFTGVFSEASPEGKLSAVEELELRGKRVLYLDDEPHRYDILKQAHMGVAVAGDFLPLEVEVISLGGSLKKVLIPKKLARRALGSALLRSLLWLGALGSALLAALSPEGSLALAVSLLFLSLT